MSPADLSRVADQSLYFRYLNPCFGCKATKKIRVIKNSDFSIVSHNQNLFTLDAKQTVFMVRFIMVSLDNATTNFILNSSVF